MELAQTLEKSVIDRMIEKVKEWKKYLLESLKWEPCRQCWRLEPIVAWWLCKNCL